MVIRLPEICGTPWHWQDENLHSWSGVDDKPGVAKLRSQDQDTVALYYHIGTIWEFPTIRVTLFGSL